MGPETCEQCQQPHLTPRGTQACAAHRKRRDEQTGRLVPCRNYPAVGQRVCRFHGGGAPQVRAAAKRRLALAAATAELDRLGGLADIEPAEAMLAMVHEAAANVAVYRRLVQSLELEQPDPAAGGLLGGTVAGPTGSTSKLLEAAPHVWVAMYDAERERLVRWAKACRDAGVDEQRVRLAESQGRQLADVLRAFTTGLQEALAARLPTARQVLDVAWRDEVPGLLRAAIESTRPPAAGAFE